MHITVQISLVPISKSMQKPIAAGPKSYHPNTAFIRLHICITRDITIQCIISNECAAEWYGWTYKHIACSFTP
jgi:hypothetical protein